MDTEKKPEVPEAEQPKPESKQNVGDIVGDLVVSGATMLANTAATAVVNQVKKAAAKSKPAKAVARAVTTAKKSGAAKTAEGKKARKSSAKASTKAGQKSATRTAKNKESQKVEETQWPRSQCIDGWH